MSVKSKPILILASTIQNLPELYDGLFRVSEDGKIYRCKGKGKYYVLAPQMKTARNGKYLMVTSTSNGKQKHYYVYRLLAEAYIPNPDNKPEVGFKDGNGHNVSINNLCWSTHKEHMERAIITKINNAKTNKEFSCTICGKLIWHKNKICCVCKEKTEKLKKHTYKAECRAKQINAVLDKIDTNKLPKRDAEIIGLYSKGLSLREIGERYSITKQAVNQFLKKYRTEKTMFIPYKHSEHDEVLSQAAEMSNAYLA